jgi:translation elongation factor EF-Ts
MLRRATLRLAAPPTTAKLIQELRYRTDAPILQCKQAIADCGGDMEKAIAWLRAKGAADSVKKHGREVAFGTLIACVPRSGSAIAATAQPAAIIEVNAETDFAVRGEKFAAFCGQVSQDLAAIIGDAQHASRSEEELLSILQTQTDDAKKALIASLGENVVLKRVWNITVPQPGLAPRYALVDQPAAFTVGKYVHNSSAACRDVGNIVGIAGLWSYKPDAKVSQEDADDFAQHLVSHLGDNGDVAAQSFLGTDQTVSQWCKQRVCRLSSGVVHKYGMDAPQVVKPKPVEAPKA